MLCLIASGVANALGPNASSSTATLSVPGRANATPTIAADGRFVAVAWGASQTGGATDVFVATSHDSGRTFNAPVRVNSEGGDVRLNGEQPASIALAHRPGRDPGIVVVWTAKGANGTTLMQARSDDGGSTFGRASIVPGSDAAGNRGWEALATEPGGRADAVWLDHRELAQNTAMATSHHEHNAADKPDGVAMAQKSKLYFVALDGTAPPVAVTGGVCYCCKTALAVGADRTIYAAWRHVYPGNLRDMAFTLSRDGGRTFAPPVRVSEDRWMLEGCPDDGPSMAVDAKNGVHLVWPTLVEGSAGTEPTIGIFYAMSVDGRTFSRRERLPAEGTPHHPRAVVLADGSVMAAWDEVAGGSRRLALAHIKMSASGRPRIEREPALETGAAVYPVLAVSADGPIAAWTSPSSAGSAIQVAGLASKR